MTLGGWMTLERNVLILRCPKGPSGGRSQPRTSRRSWPSTTLRWRVRRGRCCAARGCIHAPYARVSSARQKKDETIASQTAALRAHAEQLGLEIPDEITLIATHSES
jgi:hypothetical protein